MQAILLIAYLVFPDIFFLCMLFPVAMARGAIGNCATVQLATGILATCNLQLATCSCSMDCTCRSLLLWLHLAPPRERRSQSRSPPLSPTINNKPFVDFGLDGGGGAGGAGYRSGLARRSKSPDRHCSSGKNVRREEARRSSPTSRRRLGAGGTWKVRRA